MSFIKFTSIAFNISTLNIMSVVFTRLFASTILSSLMSVCLTGPSVQISFVSQFVNVFECVQILSLSHVVLFLTSKAPLFVALR